MNMPGKKLGRLWMKVGTRYLPFADAATPELPLGRLLRLSLFQVTVGMAITLTIGTLNRVMIVEMDVSTTLVSLMIGLPLVFAPFRALIGFKSDNHRSVLGWRRVPYIWFGSLLQFGGLAMMPFALIVLSGDSGAPVEVGKFAAGFAFLLVGAGMQMTQTAGLALATDLATDDSRPSVVALMYTMLLIGMVVSGFAFGLLLTHFSPLRLIQVVQGAAALTMVTNITAMWKQEVRDPARTMRVIADRIDFKTAWRGFVAQPKTRRFLVALGIGTVGFAMQDTLLEPYGGEILHLGVAQTTLLTAVLAGGALAAFALAQRAMVHGWDPCRLAAHGLLLGLPAFTLVLLSNPMGSPFMFRVGACLIGFSSALFSVGTLTVAMGLDREGRSGLALGAWGAVQATGAGLAIGLAGITRDVVSSLAMKGALGKALVSPATGYETVYYIEIILLFVGLAALGPLARLSHQSRPAQPQSDGLGLVELPS
jgi:BCD family chlorophyll transporter-like MFS transporter